jgi:transposase
MNSNLDHLLNLPQTTVISSEKVSDFYLLQLQLTNKGVSCPHCREYSDTLHQTQYILVRDLSISGVEVYLRVPRRRFYCRQCQRYATERLTWLTSKQLFTDRYKKYIYLQVKELTVEQVSRAEQVGNKRVQKIFDDFAPVEIKNQDIGMPKRLSLDEFSKKKGHGKFATILVDLDKSSLLEVIDSHKSDNIIKALMRLPQSMREQVEEVCVDMWGGFPKVIKEVFPNAKIVIDRFHVQKIINKNLNRIRLKLELKGLHNKILLMTAKAQLTSEGKLELESLLSNSPVLRIAHELKEEIVNIYNSNITPESGVRKINKWLKYANIIFGDAAGTLNLHLAEIGNYFRNRTTSGVTEGLNTRIKLILRQSYGFKNFDMMREKLLVCLFK